MNEKSMMRALTYTVIACAVISFFRDNSSTPILAAVGLMFFLKESYIFDRPRQILIRRPIIYKLFECSFCLGFHCGWIVYLVSKHFYNINLFDLAIFGLGSATASLIFTLCYEKVNENP